MAVFAYGRVGARDTAAAEQRAEIERAGYAVDYWYADEGISVKKAAIDRPQLRRLLDQIGDGETLVVARLDRLGRDAVDVSTTVASLAARGIKVVVLELEHCDLTSAEGKLMMTMLSAMAGMERESTVERGQAKPGRPKTAASRPAYSKRPALRVATTAGRDS